MQYSSFLLNILWKTSSSLTTQINHLNWSYSWSFNEQYCLLQTIWVFFFEVGKEKSTSPMKIYFLLSVLFSGFFSYFISVCKYFTSKLTIHVNLMQTFGYHFNQFQEISTQSWRWFNFTKCIIQIDFMSRLTSIQGR